MKLIIEECKYLFDQYPCLTYLYLLHFTLISYQKITTIITTDAAIIAITNKTVTKTTTVPIVERPEVELSFVGLVTTIVVF